MNSVMLSTFASYEVLIIDDGSTDNTYEIANNFITKNSLCGKFFYYKKNNGGKHTALNYAIERAVGRFFIILDSDDWFNKDSLSILHELCTKIENNAEFCGVMARSENAATKHMIGICFNKKILSKPIGYLEYHYKLPRGGGDYKDCCEANKLCILKQYKFPESDYKFIPERLIFDKIGIKYKLLLSNELVLNKEYLPDGITLDKKFLLKNLNGYIIWIISFIEEVVPNISDKIFKFELGIYGWYKYWYYARIAKEYKIDYKRIHKISFLGRMVRILYYVVNFIKNKVI